MNAEERKLAEMVRQLEPMPMPTYDGMKLPTFLPIRQKGAEKVMEEIKNLQTRETDIMICTLGKSGTHWIYEIVKMLLQNTTTLDKDQKVQTMLEMVMDLSLIDSLPSPRVLDTHLKFKYLPKKFIEDKGKIIHMVRNPKSVCVSSYHHALKDKCTLYEGTFDEFFDSWIIGESFPYGTWFDYELEMEQAEKDHPGMIHTVLYEQMKKEPERELKRLADFLGVKRSEEMVSAIAKATSFDNMQQNKYDSTKLFTDDGAGFIFRKGQIDDWKNYLSVAQNERLDAMFEERMKNSSYKIIFE